MSFPPEQFSLDGFAFITFRPKNGVLKKQPLFFAHSTGFSAAVYVRFLQNLADRTGRVVGAYDLRGFGQTTRPARVKRDTRLWDKMVDDHVEAYQLWFKTVAKDLSLVDRPIFIGHSLGGWISIMASARVVATRVIALDPVLLPQSRALLWASLVMCGLRFYHPIAQSVLRRNFRNIAFADISKSLKRKKFFAGWDGVDVDAFLTSSYAWDSQGMGEPIHDQRFEALLFQMQPPSSLIRFFSLPNSIRGVLPYHFLIGSRSDVCNPRAGWVLKKIFKEGSVQILEQRGHMFPLQSSDETIALMEQILEKDPA